MDASKQATDRLMLLTPDEIVMGLYVLGGFVLVWGVFVIVRAELRKIRGGAPNRRGVAPGQGYTVLHSESMNLSMGRGFGESTRTWRVPRDPQAYAKGMMPGRRK